MPRRPALALLIAACAGDTPTPATSLVASPVQASPRAPTFGLRPPVPRPDAPQVALLDPPFDGSFVASNPFDHAPDGRAGVGSVDALGQLALGTRGHRGWDWRLPLGTPVLAMADGVVRHAGAVRPFFCRELGREVSDQLAIVVQHVAPDGTVIETGLDHLSEVDVAPGDAVTAGQVIGRSGNSGCSTGEHLHVTVYRVLGERRVPSDPFGWEGPGDDPWVAETGVPSGWLWRRAPLVWFEVSRPPDATERQAPVVLSSIRWRGWRDGDAVNGERVEVSIDPRFTSEDAVALDGWTLELPGHTWRLRDVEVRAGRPLLLYAGVGSDAPGVRFRGSARPLLRDEGGLARLLDPAGDEVHALAWGLVPPGEAVPPRPVDRRAVDACPSRLQGCVPLARLGAVASPAWSPDGGQLAVRVGGAPLVVAGDLYETPALLPVDRFAGAAPDGDAGRLRWLGAHTVVFDAPASGGRRAVWAAVPGLGAAAAFPPRLGGDLEVSDAGAGVLLFTRRQGQGAQLLRWAVGDVEPVAASRSVLLEQQVALSPAGDAFVFVRNGERRVLSLVDGVEVSLGRADPARTVHAWLGDEVVVLEDGRLRVGEVAIDGLRPGLLASAGEAVVVVDTEGIAKVVGRRARVLAEHRLAGLATSEIALAGRGPGQWRLAWVADFRHGGPAGLGVAEVRE